MSQQRPFGSPNEKYKKKLFVDTGMGFKEVKARIIEPYTSPSPKMKSVAQEVTQGPAHLSNLGVSHYQVTLNLLFNDKASFHDYMMYVGWTHKFYDERGNIFLGSVESVKPKAVEASRRYKVEVSLVLIKKDEYDKKNLFKFQDIDNDWAKADIEEMANLGLITVMTVDGEPVLYFRPRDFTTRAEFVVFLNRTRRLLERFFRE